jgi:hypothetical protein
VLGRWTLGVGKGWRERGGYEKEQRTVGKCQWPCFIRAGHVGNSDVHPQPLLHEPRTNRSDSRSPSLKRVGLENVLP